MFKMSKAFHFITVMLLHISFPMNESNDINDERRTSKGLKQKLVYMLYECILLLNNLFIYSFTHIYLSSY